MKRFASLLPIALAACASGPDPMAPPDAKVRPVVVKDNLQGRWTITSVSGRPTNGPWLDLGGKGPVKITKSERGILVGAPQPATKAFLGCNNLHLNGWTRNGDKLGLGIEYSLKTERGCDDATMAIEERVHAILGKTMTMELTPPDRLRLINEHGTLDLVRAK